jgi:hypothetical protein
MFTNWTNLHFIYIFAFILMLIANTDTGINICYTFTFGVASDYFFYVVYVEDV